MGRERIKGGATFLHGKEGVGILHKRIFTKTQPKQRVGNSGISQNHISESAANSVKTPYRPEIRTQGIHGPKTL